MGKKRKTYEPVGTIYRPKPENDSPWGGIIVGFIIFMIVIAVINGNG